LGAELAPQAVPGFTDRAYNLYDADGALKFRESLQQFRKGTIAILITRTPFKCPAAPYEAALLIDSYCRARGIRENVTINIYTPEDQPMPVAGSSVGSAARAILEQRGIGYFTEHLVLKIDVESKRMLFEIDEASFDLLLGIPPHIASKVVREAGLLGPTGWIPVDAATLQTKFSDVYAIGDVNAIKLHNGMFLPKAGVFAESQAAVVAERISSRIKGEETSSIFTGEGYCYLEVGNGEAALGAGNFYATPSPNVKLEAPSPRYLDEKRDFESSRLSKWF
jgi:sulfide:quinone oxidoreductase